jgi:hypothetical protein
MAFDLSQYETVDERLHKWWERYPDGRIETEIVEASATRFIVIARAYKTEADAKPCATGLAMETISDRGVNANFALPNCETSAIGRCLSNSGLSAKGKRPSREEMAAVNEKENKVIYGRPGSRSAAVESRRMKAKPPILRLYRGVLVMSLMSLIAENQTRRLNASTDTSLKQD